MKKEDSITAATPENKPSTPKKRLPRKKKKLGKSGKIGG